MKSSSERGIPICPNLLEQIRHISWFLYIPFLIATLTVASKASSLLISWNAWWSAPWFPQRALQSTAASLQLSICSFTWNRNKWLTQNVSLLSVVNPAAYLIKLPWRRVRKDFNDASILLTALVLMYPNPRADFKEKIIKIFILVMQSQNSQLPYIIFKTNKHIIWNDR